MKKVYSLLTALVILALSVPIFSVHTAATTVAEAQNACDGILAYKESQTGASSSQDFINGYLTDRAGVDAEWYVLGLSQSSEYDFSFYESALLKYIDKSEIYSATTRQKYALALICADSSSRFISDTLNNSIGELGVMSYIYGLHLLNNGYQSSYHTAESVIGDLLSLRTSDGGWAVMGSRYDTDVTAMALCALAPYYHRYMDVTDAIDGALSLLSTSQKSDGGYYGFGGENCESTAQVLTALSCLGIDCTADKRFIKNGASVLDGMMRYRLSDGSFCHSKGGSADQNATVQAYYSLVSYLRLKRGQGSLYIIDRRSPDTVKPSKDNSSAYTPPSDNDEGYYEDEGGDEVFIHHIENIIIYEDAGEDTATAAPTQAPSQAPTQPQTSAPSSPTKTISSPQESSPSQRATADVASAGEKPSQGGYKLPVILSIIAVTIILCIALYALKKRNVKNYLFIGGIAVALILFVLLTNFSSKESYSQTEKKESIAGTVTLSIHCDTVEDQNNPYIPSDGVILEKTEITYSEGETVYDILSQAAKEHDIPLDFSTGSGYVRALNHIYEFDYGELSGWMYRVNGATPSVGCAQYTLSDGDNIEWLYTTNMGEDLNKNSRERS